MGNDILSCTPICRAKKRLRRWTFVKHKERNLAIDHIKAALCAEFDLSYVLGN